MYGAMDVDGSRVPMKKFFVFLSGKTCGAHEKFITRVKAMGQTQVDSHEDCDYVLVFCPVASRVGSDISDALNRAPAGKPMILVVMHYRSKVTTVAESRRQVNNKDVLLTVDCLFHDKGLLDCDRNYKAISEVHELLGNSRKCCRWRWILAGCQNHGRQIIICLTSAIGLFLLCDLIYTAVESQM